MNLIFLPMNTDLTPNGINDISYEYFQLFRHCEQQDKWSIEILRIFDGERLINGKL